MGLIPDEVIDEIRSRADLIAIIGQHVELKKAGRNFKGLCPFHQEKTPSFNVSPDRGFFYCFGCQKKGDAFTFVMEYEGKSFLEAAESLAARAGVTLPERREAPGAARQRSQRTRMLEINALATEFFTGVLADERRGRPGRVYLEKRGVHPDTAAHFRLGYAPDEWRALGEFLEAQRVPTELAVQVGLIVPQPRAGGFYDRFRGRLVCPVILPGGEVAGFSGRRLSTDESAGAKYINSPESPVYKKSRLLFGLHRARDGFRRAGRAVLVEGNFDVISLHQAGFDETVAPLGTAITDAQVDILRRLADEVVLLYDGDKAGRAATLKALEILVAADVKTRIATLATGDDPDAVIARGGADELSAILDRAQPGVEYFIHEVWSRSNDSADARAEALGEAARVLRKVANQTKRDLITGTLASAMGLDIHTVRRALNRGNRSDQPPEMPPPAPQGRESGPPRDQRPPPRFELELLAILAEHPELLETAEQQDVFSLLTDARLRDMYCAARRGAPMLSALPDGAPPQIAQHVLSGSYASVPDPKHSLFEMVERLRHHRTRRRLGELKREQQEAQRRGDAVRARQIFAEIVKIRKQVD